MAESRFKPCDEWSEMLSSSPDDLSTSDRIALDAHLASCPACLFVRIEDKNIVRLINRLPAPDLGRGLPSRLKQLLEESDTEDAYEEEEVRELSDIQEEVADADYIKQPQNGPSQNPQAPNLSVDAAVKQPVVSETTPASEAPERVSSVPFQRPLPPPVPPVWGQKGHFEDIMLHCRDCNQEFTFTAGEQEFYTSHNLTNAPTRCPSCRAARRGYASRGSGPREPRQMYTAICASCGNEVQVPFQPREDRHVYCSDCYRPQREGNATHNHKPQRGR